MTDDYKHIGSAIILSFTETVPTDHTLYYIQDNHISGIILFADHCRDQDSLKSWLHDLKKSLDRPLLVSVDQEGGRVRRFRHNFPNLEAPAITDTTTKSINTAATWPEPATACMTSA